jgi:hypothetical protein
MSGHSWQPENLAERGSESPPEPTISGVTCPGMLSIHYSEPEGLKTWLELVLAIEQLRAGEHVVWIDFEMSPRAIHARLDDLGATEDELERFLYMQPCEPIAGKQIQADLAELMAARKPSLAVVDSLGPALSLHGLDSNSNADVTTFYTSMLAPFRTEYTACDLIDHVTKDRETRGRWPIGAMYKLGGADLGISVEVVRKFGRGKTGLARLHVTKDRESILRVLELELSSDPDSGRITWQFKQAEHRDAESGDTWKPTVLMERVFSYLKSQAEPISRNRVVAGVKGNKQYVLQAIDQLIADGVAEETPGPQRYNLIGLVPSSVPVQKPPCTTNEEETGTPVPLSTGVPLSVPLFCTTSEGGENDDIPF